MATGPGLLGFRISAIDSTGLDWPRLVASWTLAAETRLFEAAWLSDHLSDASRERGGAAFESLTTLAALAPHVRGLWLGVAVASNTFRHPAMTAKAATVLDSATGGRFILGLGAGWHEGEHDEFGIPLPPLRERFDRFESAIRVLRALFSNDARSGPGVTLDDPFYPLRGATNEPPPMRPGGPPLWLGVTGPRGIGLLTRYADGWPMPGNRPGDVAYFREKRDEIARSLEAAGRDPSAFTFAAQLNAGESADELRRARETVQGFIEAGADHVMIGVAARLGPNAVARVASEVAAPIRDARG